MFYRALRIFLLVLIAITPLVAVHAGFPAGRYVAAQDDHHQSDYRKAPIWGYRVVEVFPHDPEAFTQGLIYLDGQLYEGTGQYGSSWLRRVELETGEVQQQLDLADEYFGEGIAIFDDRIYQLTWMNEVAFVYERESFEEIGIFTYEGEGWGLTNDDTHLIMSNGSNRIVFRDPETFRIVREIQVTDGYLPVALLNELEWIEGEIWANVLRADWIVRIDPESGDVVGWIDLSGLVDRDDENDPYGVLNGIAYDAETGRIFVTGKYWPTLFEIELVPA